MKIFYRNITIIVLVAALISPIQAFAYRPGEPEPGRGPKKVVVVKPGHKPVHRPGPVAKYHRHGLPIDATFALIAGVTYAIIDNAYYQKSGDTYVYVEQPPVTAQTTTVQTARVKNTTVSGIAAGTVVDGIPGDTTVVTVNGATYYVDGAVWYAPISGTNQFVVVAPQL